MIRYLVLPVARLANARGRNLPRRLLQLGEPVIEPTGVVGRRICFAHDFSAEHIQDLTDLAAEYGVDINLILLTQLPADWRYPPPLDGVPLR